MSNKKEKYEAVNDDMSLEDIFGISDSDDDYEPSNFIFSDEDDDEDDEYEEKDHPCVLMSNQIFSGRDFKWNFQSICESVDTQGSAFIIADDRVRYAVIDFEEYKRLKQLQSDYFEETMIREIVESDNVIPAPEKRAEDDPFILDVLECVKYLDGISTSLLQRKFRIGYGRAAMIIDYLESKNVISEYNACKPRSIIADCDYIDALIFDLRNKKNPVNDK